MKNYKTIKDNLNNCDLCIVTKHRSKDQIMTYYDLGERIFGENKAQELLTKIDLPSDIKWHFIGRLQKNKVRSIIKYVECIQSVDSYELAKVINKEALRINKTVDILVQFNIAQEETKTGISYEEAVSFIESLSEFKNINIKGIMLMGPHTDNTDEIEKVFKKGKQLFDFLKSKYSSIDTLSMGMSDDYMLGVKNGSTMVRIGSLLF